MKSYRDNRISRDSLLVSIDFIQNSKIKISLFKLREYPLYLEILSFISLVIGYFVVIEKGSLTSNTLFNIVIIVSILIIIGLSLKISFTNFYARHIDHQVLSSRIVWNQIVDIIVEPHQLEFDINQNVDANDIQVIGIGKLLLEKEQQMDLGKYSSNKHFIVCNKSLNLNKFLKNNDEKRYILAFVTNKLEVIPIVPFKFLGDLGSDRHFSQMGSLYRALLHKFPGLYIFENYKVDSGGVIFSGLPMLELSVDWQQDNMDLLVKYHGKKIKYYCENIDPLQ